MSNGGGGGGNKRNRGGGGGGGGNQQRRRRSGGSGGGNRPQAPNGPAMTALGESTYEAVFDHGGNGYGVWFDGVVRDDPMYKQFWKGTGTRPLYVRIEEDKIVLLKELDRELPPMLTAQTSDEPLSAIDDDVDAAIEEAVAEAMAAAEAAVAESEEKTYSPEEAAALFAAGGEVGDQVVAEADAASATDDVEEAEAKPKRRAVRKKAAPKAETDAGDDD
jgi:hypothetical protein